MKKEITIYYKDSDQDEYVTRRVLTQEGNYYSMSAYYMVNNKLKEFKSNLKWNNESINKYLIQCMKSTCFDHIEYQSIM